MNPWKKLDGMTQSELREMQNRKLAYFVKNYIYPFSPYYRKLFDEHKIKPDLIRTIEDLKRIPFTSKRDFVNQETGVSQFRDFVLQPDKEKIQKYWPLEKKVALLGRKIFYGQDQMEFDLAKEFRPVFMTFTTGTTSEPVPYLYSNYDISNLYVSGARMLNLFQVGPQEPLVNMFPYAPHLAFWQVVCGGFASNAFVLSTGGGKVMGTDGNIKFMQKIKPSVILGVPSYVYHVLRMAHEQNVKLDFIKKVVLGAARVTVAFKQKLAETLESMGAKDVKVFGTYGFTESRSAWAESPTDLTTSSGYYLYPDKEIFEVIDPKSGEVKGEGEDGEIVYTSLDARGSCVIRYRTGDFVKGGIIYSPCPYTKKTVPRLSSDITRLSDIKDLQLSKVKGSLVNFSSFATVLSEIDLIDEWQIEIRKHNNDPFDMDELIVNVCPKANCDEAQLVEEIKKQMQVATEVTPNEVKFFPREELLKRLDLETGNKDKRIVDNRPK